MAGPGAPGVPACLQGKAYSALIKQLDAALKAGAGEQQADTLQLLFNRGLCLQHLGLYRNAAKVGGVACRAAHISPTQLIQPGGAGGASQLV